MTRNILPNRRPNETTEADWQGHRFTVTIGYGPENGLPAEVFADTAKGGHMQATLADAAVLASIALQRGSSISELRKSVARVPDLIHSNPMGQPASPIGAILDAMGGAND